MWFRNLLVYRLLNDGKIDLDALGNALQEKPARACLSQELSTYGFTAPVGRGEDAPLAHISQGFALICARKEERILPGSVVKDAVREKVEQIENDQMRKVYKKERDQIKDEIIQSLLPHAFIRKNSTFAAIDTVAGLIYIDSASHKKAEDLLSTLRECLGSLPVRPLTVKIAPSATMTDWIKSQQAAKDFYILDRAVLTDTHEDGGKIVATRQDLMSDEIQQHLATGKLVTQMALGYQDKLSFILNDDMVIKGLRFEDLLQEQANQDGGEDQIAQIDASFSLMMLTLEKLIPDLIEALGGEDIPQGV